MTLLVPPEGPKTAKIALVGEAPGAMEVVLGRPFVGPAGDLLNRLLNNAGILRQECYITNVVKEKPPGNDIGTFIKFGTKNVTTTTEYNRYERELWQELSEVQANVIVPLGRVALYALTRYFDIGKRRGSILEGSVVSHRKVLGTIHPASALREYLDQWLILHDLVRAKEESVSPKLNLPLRNLYIEPNYEEILAYLERCQRASIVSFDIEVVNLEISCLAFALSPTDAMCIPFVGQDGHDYMDPVQEATVWCSIAEVLSNPQITKVGQNMNFDKTFVHNRYGIQLRPFEDTMVAHALLWPDFPKGLDFICAHYTREPYYKDEGKKYFRIGNTMENFWLYNAKDAVVTLEAWYGLLADLQKNNLYETYRFQTDLIESLSFMQEHGVLVDKEGLEAVRERAILRITDLTTQLQDLVGYEINPASPKQLVKLFYEEKRIKPYVSRTTGKPTTDESALKRLARKDIPEARLLLTIRKLSKLVGTYYNVSLTPSSRISSSYNPVGTTTGRLSSSETIFGIGTNMQNIPSVMKRFMLADPGYIAFKLDLAQAENRLVAYIAPEPNMIDAFERGLDIHSQTAGLIFNKPIYEVSRVEGSSSLGDGTKSERDWGKRANHALNYGLGYRKFALTHEMPETQARALVEAYHRAYPGIRNSYFVWVQSQLKRDRTLTTPFGRRRRFLGRWDEDLFRTAYAFTPQSTVGEKINRHGVAFIYQRQDLFKDVTLLNQIHDSVEFQLPTTLPFKDIARILLQIRASLEQSIQWKTYSITIPADCSMGFNFADMVKVDWFANNSVESLAEKLEDYLDEARELLERKEPVDKKVEEVEAFDETLALDDR